MNSTFALQAIGTDPGYVHHAIGKIIFRGFTYEKDKNTGKFITVPDFEILNWEHWDFTRGIVYKYDASSQVDFTRIVYPRHSMDQSLPPTYWNLCDVLWHRCWPMRHGYSRRIPRGEICQWSYHSL